MFGFGWFLGGFFSGKVESSTCTDILNFLIVLKKKKNTKKPAGPANKTAKAGMQLTWGQSLIQLEDLPWSSHQSLTVHHLALIRRAVQQQSDHSECLS